MTDKEKIREVVEKRYEYWREKESNSHSIESEIRMSECKHLLLMLDSLQEEPAPKILEDILNAKTPAESLGISAEEHDKIIDQCLYGKEPEMVDIDDLPKEEPVSEDLGDYINELSKQFPDVSFAKLSRIAIRVSRWQRNQDVKNKLPKVISRTDLDEYAYQCAYDMSNDWAIDNPTWHDVEDACKLGAKWQEKQDQSTIELAEDHAYFAGRTKTMDEINEALLSEVLPCFMHGGEADEVVDKLDEVLNRKK